MLAGQAHNASSHNHTIGSQVPGPLWDTLWRLELEGKAHLLQRDWGRQSIQDSLDRRHPVCLSWNSSLALSNCMVQTIALLSSALPSDRHSKV